MSANRPQLSSGGKSTHVFHTETISQLPLSLLLEGNNTILAGGTPRLLHETLAAPDFDPATFDAFSNPTATSAVLVILLHFIFIHQWNVRKRHVLVSYRAIVQQRQYHKLWLAILSHPAGRGSQSPQSSESPTTTTAVALNSNVDQERRSDNQQQQQQQDIRTLMNNNVEQEGRSDNQQQQQQDIRTLITSMAMSAYHSGAALMLYNSHIVWSSRALEVFYNFSEFYQQQDGDSATVESKVICSAHPLQYLRVLIALTTIALLIEFRFSYALLKISKKLMTTNMNGADEDHDGTNYTHIQRKILKRPVGTLTSLSAALVVIFREQFEYVPLQVIPFVDNQWLLLGLFSIPASLTTILCLCILMGLHPGTPVICGFVSGSLWSIGLTTFAKEAYWGNSFIAVFLVLSCISIRASTIHDRQWTDWTSSSTWIPCVDFVAWNYRGQSLWGGGNGPEEWGTSSSGSLNRAFDDDSSSTDSDVPSADSSSDSSDHDELYGRIPSNFGDSFDENDDIEMPSLVNGRAQTVRSRRGN